MMMLAAASGPGTAQNVNSRAPMMSPPTCVSGSTALTASRTNLRRTAARGRKRPLAGNNNHQPTPATETVAARVSTTNGTPQPTLATALPTASMPDHAVRPMQAAIAVHQATTPAYLSAPMRTLVLKATIGYPVMLRTGMSIVSVVEGNLRPTAGRRSIPAERGIGAPAAPARAPPPARLATFPFRLGENNPDGVPKRQSRYFASGRCTGDTPVPDSSPGP